MSAAEEYRQLGAAIRADEVARSEAETPAQKEWVTRRMRKYIVSGRVPYGMVYEMAWRDWQRLPAEAKILLAKEEPTG